VKLVQFKEINKEQRLQFLDLMLMADESEEIVTKYIHDGEMFAIYHEESIIGVALFTFESDKIVELKNMALSIDSRGKGLGKAVIKRAFEIYKDKNFTKMIVGTANSSIANIAFYQKAGFRMDQIKRDFFRNYPEPFYEDGIRAIDMIMFYKDLQISI
jgi:ribosomal protein S18 acetylase RimI-like enzyme